jgi:hypothetical protein
MVQILCAHVCKWKKLYQLKLFQEWGRRKKENDGGVNSSAIYLIALDKL